MVSAYAARSIEDVQPALRKIRRVLKTRWPVVLSVH
ncbi:MAG: hypothetical protein OEN20_05805 [Gammaproteobacteria bacterium]|nr:hypothetical protein [Gammaproteobacteria bacterium]